MLNRKSLGLLVLGAAIVAPAAGCTVQMSAKAGSPPPKAKPAPPPPPPPKPAAAKPKAPKAPPAAKPKIEKKGNTLKIPGHIVFDSGKATLKAGAGSEKVLVQLRDYLKANPDITQLRVEGHTDNVGQPPANVELSGNRALTIKKWLVDHGIKAERILAAGFGESKPVADNAAEEGRAENRRTEFKIAGLKGKPYAGRKPDGGGKVFK